MFDEVDARVDKRGVVEAWQVPGVQAADVERSGDKWMPHEMRESSDRSRARQRPHHAAAHPGGNTTQERSDRRAEHEERRGNDREKHVLDHVHRERNCRVAIDRRRERREKRGEACEKERRAPQRPASPHPRHPDRVSDGGERCR